MQFRIIFDTQLEITQYFETILIWLLQFSERLRETWQRARFNLW